MPNVRAKTGGIHPLYNCKVITQQLGEKTGIGDQMHQYSLRDYATRYQPEPKHVSSGLIVIKAELN